jgi:hypothetical protein
MYVDCHPAMLLIQHLSFCRVFCTRLCKKKKTVIHRRQAYRSGSIGIRASHDRPKFSPRQAAASYGRTAYRVVSRHCVRHARMDWSVKAAVQRQCKSRRRGRHAAARPPPPYTCEPPGAFLPPPLPGTARNLQATRQKGKHQFITQPETA